MPNDTIRGEEEIRRLRSCINDLISIQALPAIWSGQDAANIVRTLLDVLVRVLSLDFAHARLVDSIYGSQVEFVRLAHRRNPSPQAQEIGHALERWLTHNASTAPLTVPNPAGDGDEHAQPHQVCRTEPEGDSD